MNADLEQLEHEVQRLLAPWAGLLDVPVPHDVLQRLRAAVRVELEECLPAGYPDPRPSPAVLSEVRRAVRAELARQGERSWRQALAALAAAAMVVLCVGLIYLSGAQNSRPGGSGDIVAEAQTSVELFVMAAERALAGDDLTGGLDERLEWIEHGLENWRLEPEDPPASPDTDRELPVEREPATGPTRSASGGVG